jgi:phosphonate transport system substrate-binding protein
MTTIAGRSIATFLLAALLLAGGCGIPNQSGGGLAVEVDFSDTLSSSTPQAEDPNAPLLRVAIASMTSPTETFTSYEELVYHLSTKLARPVKMVQRRSYQEVNDLLKSQQIEIAFICSGAYVDAREQFPIEILAIPVVQGKTKYQAYVIARESSSIKQFADLRGRSFAFTDPLSNSGHLHGLQRLAELGATPQTFFSKVVFTNAHDQSIRAVAHGVVDGATVNGLIFDFLKIRRDENVRDIRVIEASDPYGMPPVVTHRNLDSKTKEHLRTVLLEMHLDEDGRATLAPLLIDRFTSGREDDYESIGRP